MRAVFLIISSLSNWCFICRPFPSFPYSMLSSLCTSDLCFISHFFCPSLSGKSTEKPWVFLSKSEKKLRYLGDRWGKGKKEGGERNERIYSGSSNHGGCLMDCSVTQRKDFPTVAWILTWSTTLTNVSFSTHLFMDFFVSASVSVIPYTCGLARDIIFIYDLSYSGACWSDPVMILILGSLRLPTMWYCPLFRMNTDLCSGGIWISNRSLCVRSVKNSIWYYLVDIGVWASPRVCSVVVQLAPIYSVI